MHFLPINNVQDLFLYFIFCQDLSNTRFSMTFSNSFSSLQRFIQLDRNIETSCKII